MPFFIVHQIHYDRITSLQKAMFVRFPEMRKFALATVASIDDRASLAKHFGSLKKETLYDVAEYLFLVPPRNDDNDFCDAVDREFLIELLISRHEKRESQLQVFLLLSISNYFTFRQKEIFSIALEYIYKMIFSTGN